jgi:hypothetical protein
VEIRLVNLAPVVRFQIVFEQLVKLLLLARLVQIVITIRFVKVRSVRFVPMVRLQIKVEQLV